MSEVTAGQLQTTEQGEGSQASQQAGKQHVNIADPLSKPKEAEGSENEQPVKAEQDNSHHQQEPQLENQYQQAETNSFQLAEKDTSYFAQQKFASSNVDVCQPPVDQQNTKQTVAQQAPAGGQDTVKGPSIPFNMLIPILQAHLDDRYKDMQLQTVWAKLRRNEVHKDEFLRVVRNVVGDQMLKQAAHKVFMQMQAQAQRNNQSNQSHHTLFSQAPAQQVPSSGFVQSLDQHFRPPAPPNQCQKKQVSYSPRAFAPSIGTQAQNNVHYLAHANPNKKPDAKGVNAMVNQPPRPNSAVSLQTRNMQQSTQFQQFSQQLYGTSNPSAQAYPHSITGSIPPRPPSSVPETQPSMHAHGMVAAKMGTPPTHPTVQYNLVRPMQQKRGVKSNALLPTVNATQDSESAGKARVVGTGNSSSKMQVKQEHLIYIEHARPPLACGSPALDRTAKRARIMAGDSEAEPELNLWESREGMHGVGLNDVAMSSARATGSRSASVESHGSTHGVRQSRLPSWLEMLERGFSSDHLPDLTADRASAFLHATSSCVASLKTLYNQYADLLEASLSSADEVERLRHKLAEEKKTTMRLEKEKAENMATMTAFSEKAEANLTEVATLKRDMANLAAGNDQLNIDLRLAQEEASASRTATASLQSMLEDAFKLMSASMEKLEMKVDPPLARTSEAYTHCLMQLAEKLQEFASSFCQMKDSSKGFNLRVPAPVCGAAS